MRLIDADKITFFDCLAKTGNAVCCHAEDIVSKSAIEMQPTVKAIPIELIEKEMKRLDEDIKWAWYYGNTALDKMEYLKTWLTIKLEDWEKENARD